MTNSRTANVRKARLQNLLFHLLLGIAVLLTGWLGTRHNWVWDWSDNARNSLSPGSVQILEKLESPLRITAFVPGEPRLRRQISGIVERYRRHRPDISLAFVDPSRNPALTRELGIRVSGEMRLEYQGRSELLREIDEQNLGNAIQRLLQREERWIVSLEGHGERRLDSQANHDLGLFGDQLRRKGYKVQTLNLAAEPLVPANTALLVIASPQHPYLEAETRLLLDYIEEGGNLLWLMEPDAPRGLEPISNAIGARVLPGILVDANAASLGLDDPTMALVPRYPEHPATRSFDLTSLFPQAAAIEAVDYGDWEAAPLLSTLPNSWNETGSIQGQISRNPELGEQAGPLPLGIAFTREHKGRQQRVMVIGDGDFLSNTFLGNGGNLDLGLNLVRWLSREERLMDIPSRISPDRTFDLTPAAGTLIGLVFLILLPAGLLLTGALIWWRRRRL